MYLATVLTIIFTIGILLFGLLINEFFRDYAIPVLAGIMIVGGILTALGGMDVFRHVPNFSLRFEASPIILLAITLLHVLVNLMKVPKAKQVRTKWGLLLMAMGFGLAFGSLWSLIVAITCR